MKTNRFLALAVALAALLPALAAGRAACCLEKTQAAVKPACCPAMAARAAAAPKGCCKAPVAPKPEAKAKEGAPLATAFSPVASVAPAAAAGSIPSASAVRIARLAHRADSPDDSPPDLLSRISVLQI
jgi:hypothetical protein